MENNKIDFSAVKLVAFDFDGVFTDNCVYVSQDGIEMVRCWLSDGLGLSRLQEKGIHAVIISTEKNPVVAARAKKLNLPFLQGVENKATAILSTCKGLGIAPDLAAFVGNDINDIAALKIVGLPIVVADAYPEVRAFSLYITAKPGGFGAVREVCDLIYDAHNH